VAYGLQQWFGVQDVPADLLVGAFDQNLLPAIDTIVNGHFAEYFLCDSLIKPAMQYTNLRHPGLDPGSSNRMDSGSRQNDEYCDLWLPG
jgi:hypothetical protein